MTDHISASPEHENPCNELSSGTPGAQALVVVEDTYPFADAPALLEDALVQMSSAEQGLDVILGHLAAARRGLLELFAGPLNGTGLNVTRATLATVAALEVPDTGIVGQATNQAMQAHVDRSDASVSAAQGHLARAFRPGVSAIGTLKRLQAELLVAGGQIMDASQEAGRALGERQELAVSAQFIGPEVHLRPVRLELDARQDTI